MSCVECFVPALLILSEADRIPDSNSLSLFAVSLGNFSFHCFHGITRLLETEEHSFLSLSPLFLLVSF